MRHFERFSNTVRRNKRRKVTQNVRVGTLYEESLLVFVVVLMNDISRNYTLPWSLSGVHEM